MAIRLQCEAYLKNPSQDQENEPAAEAPLRQEHGWPLVASGLMRVVAGHLIMVGASIATLVVIIFTLGTANPQKVQDAFHDDTTLLFLAVMGLGIASLIGYYYLLTGKWICAASSPERHNAKWFIFACMVCILLGPALSLSVTFFGAEGLAQEALFDDDGNLYLYLESPATLLQIAGAILGLVSTVCFVLFLHAVGACFRHQTVQALSLGFLIAVAVLGGFTLQELILNNQSRLDSELLRVVGICWAVCGVWYLALILLARSCILRGLANERSPLEAEVEEPSTLAEPV